MEERDSNYSVPPSSLPLPVREVRCKLKEDLSRERQHNELTRKKMIREMEQKMDKSATALTERTPDWKCLSRT